MEYLKALYANFFSKPPGSRLNDALLNYALRARGYNNHKTGNESGENYFLSEVLAPYGPKLCVDVGANVGSYTLKLLEHTDATVISFEPLPYAFEELRGKCNGYENRVLLENCGVGEKTEVLTIHHDPRASTKASISEAVKKVAYVNNHEKSEIDVVSLDSYFSNSSHQYLDFIKIDTEGYELEVLKGASETIREYKPQFIQIEFNWHQLFRNSTLNYFYELLADYNVYQLLPGGWAERDPRDPLSNIYCFSNFVFVRK